LKSEKLTPDNQYEPEVITRTFSRSSTILKSFVNHRIDVYNGRRFRKILIQSHHVGFKLGQFVFTKKMGKSIHNSIRNAKKKEKMRRKITDKKVRKGVPNVSRSKKAKAKAIAQSRMKKKKKEFAKTQSF